MAYRPYLYKSVLTVAKTAFFSAYRAARIHTINPLRSLCSFYNSHGLN
jgi:hypothetical protein